MKKLFYLLVVFIVLGLSQSCKKESTSEDTSLGGAQSPMGVVGTTISSAGYAISGISGLSGSVVSLKGGISSYACSGTITNSAIKNLLSNNSAFTISGDNVSASGFKFKQTLEGIESYIGSGEGTIVKYASNVGDTYSVGSTGRTRTVVSKSTTDDYNYSGLLIKVMKIEEPTPGLKSIGISKITYWANHKFGLVGVQYDLTDGTSLYLPIYSSTTNS